MKPEIILTHEFVEAIPDALKERTLYVSIKFATVVHKCCCGCGREVVTPLTPTDWKLTFDGETISLHPSVGSWNLPCQSHYWIQRNRAVWAKRWSREEIEVGKAADAKAKAVYYGTEMPTKMPYSVPATPAASGAPASASATGSPKLTEGFWQAIKRWIWPE